MSDKQRFTSEPENSMARKRELLRQLLPPERLKEALRLLDEGKRILALSEGQISVSSDFDEPFPDEFWGDLFE
jgi:hypothetical protein